MERGKQNQAKETKQTKNKVKRKEVKDSPSEDVLSLPGNGARKLVGNCLMAPENLVLDVESCWEPQEQGVKSTAASLPSVETEVIEPEGGRKRHTGVASNAETCTTQTQDFAPTNQ